MGLRCCNCKALSTRRQVGDAQTSPLEGSVVHRPSDDNRDWLFQGLEGGPKASTHPGHSRRTGHSGGQGVLPHVSKWTKAIMADELTGLRHLTQGEAGDRALGSQIKGSGPWSKGRPGTPCRRELRHGRKGHSRICVGAPDPGSGRRPKRERGQVRIIAGISGGVGGAGTQWEGCEAAMTMPLPTRACTLSQIPIPGQDNPRGPRLQAPNRSQVAPLLDPPSLPLIQLFI